MAYVQSLGLKAMAAVVGQFSYSPITRIFLVVALLQQGVRTMEIYNF